MVIVLPSESYENEYVNKTKFEALNDLEFAEEI